MFDSIFIGMSGLQSFSKGLKVISNNVANLNTPGFKSSNTTFADLYNQGGGVLGSATRGGSGVTTLGTHVNFLAGDTRQTGNPLDLSINGDGFFVLRDKDNQSVVYTRAGQFQIDKDGYFVTADGKQVQGYGSDGKLGPINISSQKLSPAKASTKVQFNGNLSSAMTDFSIDSVKVFDAVGGEHVLKATFKLKQADASSSTWTVTLLDGATTVGTGEIKFAAGTIVAGSDKITFNYAPSGVPAMSLSLDFSSQVTSFSTGQTSSLAVSSVDGYASGTLSAVTFDDRGVMQLAYSNGQKATGPQLALAMFDSKAELEQQSGGLFVSNSAANVHIHRAGLAGSGSIASSQVEGSNVDLSSEFSNLIVMQRGYQASSRLVSTANDMIQELFDMKGHR
jgi:flagellar hook protein FlgE